MKSFQVWEFITADEKFIGSYINLMILRVWAHKGLKMRSNYAISFENSGFFFQAVTFKLC